MQSFGLNKSDKLCSPIAIESLFSNGASSDNSDSIRSLVAYPLRAVWKTYEGQREEADIKFLISVPKKRLRHAVDRVKMRRRIREAYRLNINTYIKQQDKYVDIAFIYISDGLKKYDKIEKSMLKIIGKINEDNSPNIID